LGVGFSAIIQHNTVVLIVGQSNISENWRKFHASANQIPESPEIKFFLRKFLLFGLVHHQKHV
jgi:hypothetical protein